MSTHLTLPVNNGFNLNNLFWSPLKIISADWQTCLTRIVSNFSKESVRISGRKKVFPGTLHVHIGSSVVCVRFIIYSNFYFGLEKVFSYRFCSLWPCSKGWKLSRWPREKNIASFCVLQIHFIHLIFPIFSCSRVNVGLKCISPANHFSIGNWRLNSEQL